MIQRTCEILGKYGCYFLCLCKSVDNFRDCIIEFDYFVSKKWLGKDCTVLDPVSLLFFLSKSKITINSVEKVKSKDKFIECAKNARLVIGVYKHDTYTHFVLLDKDLNVTFDPLGKSNTVQKGKLEELRIFN